MSFPIPKGDYRIIRVTGDPECRVIATLVQNNYAIQLKMPEDIQLRPKINDFARRCFRDNADRDYISARMNYRVQLMPQFHWAAAQAIEKYFKCILLLNRIKAKSVRHDLSKALKLTQKLPFKVDLSDTTLKLITHLNRVAKYRYLEGSQWIYGPKFLELDRAVWELRRFCKPINVTTTTDGNTVNLLKANIEEIEKAKDAPHNYSIQGGWIEKVLENKNHPARPHCDLAKPFFRVASA